MPSIQENIRGGIDLKDIRAIRDGLIRLPAADIADLIKEIPDHDQALIFRILPRDLAADTFEYLDFEVQHSLLNALGGERVAVLLNEMSPDDRTALLEECPAGAARQLVGLLSKEERSMALKLLGYPEGSVGRLMSADYIVVKPEWTMAEVLAHVREHGRKSDSINVLYVLDSAGRLIDDVRIRDVLLAPLEQRVADLMNHSFIALQATQDQESAVEIFKRYDRTTIPVVDSTGAMLGIVTIDDVLDVAEEEATEDIHKLGGVEALENPYIQIPLAALIRKRATWLIILFLGELMTASVMAAYEDEIAKAVILALFVPLIISSGGNSGSQAATLVIRALAIGEIGVKDWFRVLHRELISGLALGVLLGTIGVLRIWVWESWTHIYGPHWFWVAMTVGASLVGVVVWGTVCGAMLPLVLKRVGLDPATSSAPFVATLVDVTGLIIYFSFAAWLLSGLLL